MTHTLYFWIGFNLFVALMLLLDLGLLHRNSRVMSMKEAFAWSVFWIGLAGGFAVFVYFWHGGQSALEFITGYVVEESMSVDNLFVFLVLFQYFRVPREHQYKVLFWGIIGALVLRLTFILVGVSILQRFEFVIYSIDSIPAILAITRDAFIVYTSNVFAILGLRALYFAISGLMTLFHYLHYGLAVILMFVGAKMLASHYFDLPVTITLGVIAAVLAISIGASLIWPQKKTAIPAE